MGRIFDIILGLLVLVGTIAIIIMLMMRALKRSDDPARLVVKWGLSAFFIPIVWIAAHSGPLAPMIAGVGGLLLAIIWAPSFSHMLARPLTDALDGGLAEAPPEPLYSMAESKRKLGKYAEAVDALKSELTRFPNDYRAQMMIAEIQAENLKDVTAAQDTIHTMLQQEGHHPKNVAFSLNRLADWQLSIANKPDAAIAALEWITQLYPNTEEAYNANQRLARIDPIQGEVKKDARKIVLKHYEEKLGLMEDFTGLKPTPEDLGATAESYVRQLELHPHDNEIREKLATLYATHYQNLDLAVDQLEQMIAQPGAPTRKIVHWLNLMADWQIKHGQNEAAARRALQRIVEQFPDNADAEMARQRLGMVGLEMKALQIRPTVKIGIYEQKIGLKESSGDTAPSEESQPIPPIRPMSGA